MTVDTKTCRDCGAEFERSPADVTVRCPACRAAGRKPKDPTLRPTHSRPVSAAGRTCTVRSAVTGVCGEPAVFAFESSTGEVFAECAAHKI